MMGVASLPHLIAVPVVLPLVTAAVLLAVDDRRRSLKAGLSLLSMLGSLLTAIALAVSASNGPPGTFGVYLPGNWQAPFGIVLVADRLAAMMLVLAACTGLASLVFSFARWHRASVHFHPLLQLQLMGLNGAFLTADLFNLFVFFEVLLAASYGLLLHGGGTTRVRAGLHYIAVNLLASLLFLVGVALLYGVTGTLNMADIAARLPHVPAGDRGLLHAAAALLGCAFLAKAALWPLNFWLPSAYAAASAPSAAMFAILTKVGVYAVLRLWTLCFPAGAGESALFGGPVLLWGGFATVLFGATGMLASQQLGRLAGYSVITSSGTVIAAMSMDVPDVTGAALFYMASSTLAACALFLLVELIERARQFEVDPPSPEHGEGHVSSARRGAAVTNDTHAAVPTDANLDDQRVVLVGRVMPAAVAFLGIAFLLCTVVLAGLPPLSGFVGKFAMLHALLDSRQSSPTAWAGEAWALFALLLISGLLATIALTRAFIARFWSLTERAEPDLRVSEGLPIALLLAACTAMSLGGDAALTYTRQAAAELHTPALYRDAVLKTRPVPSPWEEKQR